MLFFSSRSKSLISPNEIIQPASLTTEKINEIGKIYNQRYNKWYYKLLGIHEHQDIAKDLECMRANDDIASNWYLLAKLYVLLDDHDGKIATTIRTLFLSAFSTVYTTMDPEDKSQLAINNNRINSFLDKNKIRFAPTTSPQEVSDFYQHLLQLYYGDEYNIVYRRFSVPLVKKRKISKIELRSNSGELISPRPPDLGLLSSSGSPRKEPNFNTYHNFFPAKRPIPKATKTIDLSSSDSDTSDDDYSSDYSSDYSTDSSTDYSSDEEAKQSGCLSCLYFIDKVISKLFRR